MKRLTLLVIEGQIWKRFKREEGKNSELRKGTKEKYMTMGRTGSLMHLLNPGVSIIDLQTEKSQFFDIIINFRNVHRHE